MDYLPNRIECSEGSKSSALLEPVAHDLTFLMLYFLAEVQQGASLSFDTFKTIWRKLRFSLLLTVGGLSKITYKFMFLFFLSFLKCILIATSSQICPRRQSQHSYMQALYAVPLIAVRSGISAETLSHIATEDTSQAIKKDHGLDLTSLLQVNDFVDICKHGSIQLTFAAICTLYCLYFAQQIAPKVRIHVSLDHQDALKGKVVGYVAIPCSFF